MPKRARFHRLTTGRTVAGLILGGLMLGGPMLAAHAEQTAAAPETTSDPTLRPGTQMPVYPPQSRKKQEAGVVRVKLCVDEAGRTTKADLAESSGFPNLDNAVLKWVKDIRFNPAMKGPAPVAVCDFPLKYEFQVTKGKDQLQTRTTNPFDIGPANNNWR